MYKKLFNSRIFSNGDIHFDSAATTPPFLAVENVVANFLKNYGSVHRGAGRKSKLSTSLYEKSREDIKDFVNASSDSNYVVFTKNTTEAMNQLAHFFSFLPGKIAVSHIEHSSSSLPFIVAEGLRGGDLTEIQNLGRLQVLEYENPGHLEKLLTVNKIKAVVVTAASNVTGYCPPIKEISEIVHRNRADSYLIVDACQYVQHHSISMLNLGIDFLCASGHKMYAPYGAGFYVAPKTFLDQFIPYQIGGGNLPYITSEREFIRYQNNQAHDPGTPNALGAVAIAAAIEQLQEIGLKEIQEYEFNLTNLAFSKLKKVTGISLYVDEKKITNIIPFNLNKWNFNELAEILDTRYNIAVRAGSFCVYNFVREIMGIGQDEHIANAVRAGDKSLIPGFVRASFSLLNDETDVEVFTKAIKELANER